METNYIASEALKSAIEVAKYLQKPLLVSGEPGTGKTELAKYIQATMGIDLYRFNTKTTSTATDLFYTYDAVSHFRSSYDKSNGSPNSSSDNSIDKFIELRAMGLAIASSLGSNSSEVQKLTGIKNFSQISSAPKGSLVLIDEIDKAPRDFPNDLLNELEYYEFEVKELNKKISSDKTKKDAPPIFVLMTSNNERVLPEPFLRRCIYYHIPFPDTGQLTQIVLSKSELKNIDPQKIKIAIELFNKMRDKVIHKKPATAELIDWIKVLNWMELFKEGIEYSKLQSSEKEKFETSCYALFKNKQDIDSALKS